MSGTGYRTDHAGAVCATLYLCSSPPFGAVCNATTGGEAVSDAQVWANQINTHIGFTDTQFVGAPAMPDNGFFSLVPDSGTTTDGNDHWELTVVAFPLN